MTRVAAAICRGADDGLAAIDHRLRNNLRMTIGEIVTAVLPAVFGLLGVGLGSWFKQRAQRYQVLAQQEERERVTREERRRERLDAYAAVFEAIAHWIHVADSPRESVDAAISLQAVSNRAILLSGPGVEESLRAFARDVGQFTASKKRRADYETHAEKLQDHQRTLRALMKTELGTESAGH